MLIIANLHILNTKNALAKIMDKYIGSQQHWEDNINADYNERERQQGEQSEQVDNRTQPDPRVKPKGIIYWFYYVLPNRFNVW